MLRQPKRRNIIAATTAALLAAAAGAHAQNYQISLNGGPFGESIIAMPGQEVEVSVWLTNGLNLQGFSGWADFGFELTLTGATTSTNFVGFTEQTTATETMPNPSATGTTGWNTAPDTWQRGRRPGAGTAFDGAITHNGWRLDVDAAFDPASYTATGPNGNVLIEQDGLGVISGRQGLSPDFAPFASEFLNTSVDIEIFRFQFTPTFVGGQSIDINVRTVTAGAFLNSDFTTSVDVLGSMGQGATVSIVIPTPASAALLTLAALAAARRRRGPSSPLIGLDIRFNPEAIG